MWAAEQLWRLTARFQCFNDERFSPDGRINSETRDIEYIAKPALPSTKSVRRNMNGRQRRLCCINKIQPEEVLPKATAYAISRRCLGPKVKRQER